MSTQGRGRVRDRVRPAFLPAASSASAEPVEDAQPLLVPGAARSRPRRRIDSATPNAPFSKKQIPSISEVRSFPRERATPSAARRSPRQQAHLLERDAEIVVRLEIGLVDVLVDPCLNGRSMSWKSCPRPGRLLVSTVMRVSLAGSPSSSSLSIEPRSY